MSSDFLLLAQQFSQLHLSEEATPAETLYNGLDQALEDIITLREGSPSANTARKEVYFVLENAYKDSLPSYPLERDGRRTIKVFSLGQFTGGSEDTFSIMCEPSQGMMYLNVRIRNPPPIGESVSLYGMPDEQETPFMLQLMSGSDSQFGIQRKRKDRSGRTVFQFPFHAERDAGVQILDVIHEIMCRFESRG